MVIFFIGVTPDVGRVHPAPVVDMTMPVEDSVPVSADAGTEILPVIVPAEAEEAVTVIVPVMFSGFTLTSSVGRVTEIAPVAPVSGFVNVNGVPVKDTETFPALISTAVTENAEAA